MITRGKSPSFTHLNKGLDTLQNDYVLELQGSSQNYWKGGHTRRK